MGNGGGGGWGGGGGGGWTRCLAAVEDAGLFKKKERDKQPEAALDEGT